MSARGKAKELFGSLEPGDTFFTSNYGPVMPDGMPREWFVACRDASGLDVLVCKTYVITEHLLDGIRYGLNERWEYRQFDEWEFVYSGAVATQEELT